MELNEALARVIRGHWRLLTACLILPVLVVCLLDLVVAPRAYASTARLQASSSSPGTDTEADAVLNRISGIATSPAVVDQALHDAAVTDRNTKTATSEITVTRLGSSAVFDMAVADPDPAVATALAAALSTDTVNFLNGVGGPSSKLVNNLTDHQNQLLTQRQQVASQLGLAHDPVTIANLTAQVAGIDQQLNQISSSLSTLQFNASGTSAVLISAAGPAVTVASHASTDMGLALVLGLVLGLLLASLIEVLRPHVADGRAFAREIGAPVLGHLPRRIHRGQDDSAAEAVESTPGTRLLEPETTVAFQHAATRAGVDSVVLVGSVEPQLLEDLAGELTRNLARTAPPPTPRPRFDHNGTGPAGTGAGPTPAADDRRPTAVLDAPALETAGPVAPQPAPALRVVSIADVGDAASGNAYALVPVIRALSPYSEVRQIADLVATTGWPVIGVLADPVPAAARGSRRSRS